MALLQQEGRQPGPQGADGQVAHLALQGQSLRRHDAQEIEQHAVVAVAGVDAGGGHPERVEQQHLAIRPRLHRGGPGLVLEGRHLAKDVPGHELLHDQELAIHPLPDQMRLAGEEHADAGVIPSL